MNRVILDIVKILYISDYSWYQFHSTWIFEIFPDSILDLTQLEFCWGGIPVGRTRRYGFWWFLLSWGSTSFCWHDHSSWEHSFSTIVPELKIWIHFRTISNVKMIYFDLLETEKNSVSTGIRTHNSWSLGRMFNLGYIKYSVLICYNNLGAQCFSDFFLGEIFQQV